MGLVKKIGENFFWRGLYLASLFVINLVMARSMGANASGRFFLLINNLAFVILLTSICLEAAIVFLGASRKIAIAKLATMGLLWCIPATIVSVLILSFSGLVPKESYNLPVLTAYIFSFLLINTITALFHSQQNFATVNQVLLSVNCLFILFFFILSTQLFGLVKEPVTDKSAVYRLLIWGYFITVFSQGLLLIIVLRIKFPSLRWCFPNKDEWRMMSWYAFQSLASNIIFFLVSRVAYWFVQYYCEESSLGNYIQVSRLGQIFILPSVLIAGSLFPQTAGGHVSLQKSNFTLLSRIFVVLYIVALLATVILGRPVISFLWGTEYNELYGAWVLYVPGVLFLAISYLFSPYFAGKGKVAYNIMIGILTLIIVVGGSYVLIPIWGIRGAALASSGGFMIMMIAYIIIAKIKFGYRFRFKPVLPANV